MFRLRSDYFSWVVFSEVMKNWGTMRGNNYGDTIMFSCLCVIISKERLDTRYCWKWLQCIWCTYYWCVKWMPSGWRQEWASEFMKEFIGEFCDFQKMLFQFSFKTTINKYKIKCLLLNCRQKEPYCLHSFNNILYLVKPFFIQYQIAPCLHTLI